MPAHSSRSEIASALVTLSSIGLGACVTIGTVNVGPCGCPGQRFFVFDQLPRSRCIEFNVFGLGRAATIADGISAGIAHATFGTLPFQFHMAQRFSCHGCSFRVGNIGGAGMDAVQLSKADCRGFAGSCCPARLSLGSKQDCQHNSTKFEISIHRTYRFELALIWYSFAKWRTCPMNIEWVTGQNQPPMG